MNSFNSLRRKIYEVNDGSIEDIAIELFRFQATRNPVYATFLNYLKVDPSKVHRLDQVPFFPISFFKRHDIQTERWKPEIIFSSSGTTGSIQSRHLVDDLKFYLDNTRRCFESAFSSLSDFHFLALLPSYLERSGSSLVSMMDHFIKESRSPHSGFYLNDLQSLVAKVEQLKDDSRKVVIWGVTFALLDLAEQFSVDISHCLVMETGGMKGRRREITRTEFYEHLKARLNAKEIYSEYGMTELMSQAYTKGDTRFTPPPLMKIFGRDLSDPMAKSVIGETAGINILDLANIHSIAFLETEDLGKVYQDGTFEILGRIDNSDVRGCNLMI